MLNRFRLWLARLVLPRRYVVTLHTYDFQPAQKELVKQVEILWQERLDGRDPRLLAAQAPVYESTLQVPLPNDPIFEQTENL